MRKSLFIIAILFPFIAAVAQPRAIGARFGYNNEASYQHSMDKQSYLQFDAGMLGFGDGVQAVATYNFIFATPDWTDYGTWEWFVGAGAGLGVNWENNNNSYFFLGAVGNIGLAYNFEFPLQIAVDFRPIIGPRFYEDKISLYDRGFLAPAISVRFRL
jgi:hypothetical protein